MAICRNASAEPWCCSHLLERVGADDRVRLHDDALVGVELARLEQDVIGQAHLADVVQRRTALQHLDEVGVDLAGEGRRPAASSARQRQ